MKLVVGLGNPGKIYARTRHNVGFMVLDAFGFDFRYEKKFESEVAKNDDVLYVKPQTFMNESGRAVRALLDFYKLKPEDVIVVYDDKDMPFGTIRLRSSGGSAGHNGIKSLIQHLGTDNFGRVRIGILPSHLVADTATFVLSRFSKTEETVLPDLIRAAAEAINSMVHSGFSKEKHTDIHL